MSPAADRLIVSVRTAGRAAFAGGRRGTVKPGLDADLVVLDRDILGGGPSAIMGTKVALTVVGGEIVHRSEDAG